VIIKQIFVPLLTTRFPFDLVEILFLSSNQLNGNIPDSIGHPNSGERPLRGLYLSDNSFESSIPSSLCGLENLEALFLDENRLDGSIPDCLGLIQSLQQLYLFKNKLSGEIPSELSSLRQLCKSWSFFSKYFAMVALHLTFFFRRTAGIGLEENDITGEVPNDMCALASVSAFDFWADCGGSSPELSCECCTVCCPSADCSA
jgi:Leucine-rich repeat (LRR) protein